MNYFSIIMSGYNCAPWIQRSIESACTQSFPLNQFSVHYMDAKSTDGTFEKALELTTRYKNLKVSQNDARKFQVENLLSLTKSSKEYSICVSLDGDDWFPHDKVLIKLHETYKTDVWLTYGYMLEWPEMKGATGSFAGSYSQETIENNNFRSDGWRASHLRTWRRELFLKIKDEDLRDTNGQYVDMVGDLTFMFPMLEMAGKHSRYIPDIMYVYNGSNPLGESKINKENIKRIDAMNRARKKYKPLADLYYE